jgi:tRNA(fMet)-specific endonuclease VapC
VLTHLLDTDICIHAMKARDLGLSRRLDALKDKCAISDISLFELYAGAQRYDAPERRMDIIDGFTARLAVLPFNSEAARIGGPLRYDLESRGEKIGGLDVLIAAIALANGLTLFTNNTREFKRVPGLLLESFVKHA